MWPTGWDVGGAQVVRFPTLVVFWSDARPIGLRAHPDISLEGPLEGPDILKARRERCARNRVLMDTHQVHRTTLSEWSDIFGERRAKLRVGECGESLALQASQLRGGVTDEIGRASRR